MSEAQTVGKAGQLLVELKTIAVGLRTLSSPALRVYLMETDEMMETLFVQEYLKDLMRSCLE